jgi:hypothetical protein
MVVAIALCFAAFTWIYTELDPYLTDFVGAEPGAPTATVRAAAATGSEDKDPTEEPTAEPTDAPEPTEQADNTVQEANSSGTDTAFQATHTSNPDFRINLRPGPSVDSGTEITQLDPGTELQFLGDEETDDDGEVWMHVQTEDGFDGWIREIDTVPIG